MASGGNPRDVALRITAQEKAQRTFDAVAKSVRGITDEIEKQVDAAKRGEVTTKALGASLDKLKELDKQLGNQEAAILYYQQLENELKTAGDAATASRTKLADFQQQVAKTGGVTKEQAAAIRALSSEANKADKSVDGLTAKLQRQASLVEGLGLDTKSLGAAQEVISKNATELGAAYNFVNRALDDYQDNLRAVKAAEAAQRAAAETQQFRQTGVQASLNAGEIDRIARSSTAADRAVNGFAGALRSIVDPSAEAIRSLSGLEGEIERIAAEVGDGSKPLKEYQDSIIALNQAQNAILKQGGLIGSYRDQAKAVGEAEAAYGRAQAEVRRYAAAVASADEPNEALAVDLRRAEAGLASASREMQNQRTKLAELGRSLKSAGIDVKQLDDAERRLIITAQGAAAATQKIEGAIKGSGSKVGSFLGLRPYELTNLSYQINDVFTSLASGISPMQTLAQQGPQIVQLFPGMTSGILRLLPLLAPLAIAFGVLNKEMGDRAERREFLGFLGRLADGSRYSVDALVEARKSLQAYGATADEARDALKAFIEAGIQPERLAEFGKTARDTADALGVEMKDAVDLLVESFNGGYDAIVKLDEKTQVYTVSERARIRELFDAGRAEDARRLALDLFANKMRQVADDSVGPWSRAARSLKSAWQEFTGYLSDTSPVVGMANAIDQLARAAENTIRKLQGVRELRDVDYDINILQTRLSAGESFDPEDDRRRLALALKERAKLLAAQKKDTQDSRNAAVEENTVRTSAHRDNMRRLEEERTATLKNSDADRIRLAGLKALRDAQDRKLTDPQAREAQAFAEETERAKIAEDNRKKAATEGKRLAAEAKALQARITSLSGQLVNDLRQMDAKIGRDQIQSIEQRANAITQTYAKVYDNLDKFRATAGPSATIDGISQAAYRKRLQANEQILKDQETMAFYEDKLKSLEEERAAGLKLVQDRITAGNVSAADGLRQAQEINNRLHPAMVATANEAVRFARSLNAAQVDPAFIAKMEATSERPQSAGVAAISSATLNGKEQELNNIIAERNQLVAAENVLVELGLKTRQDADAVIEAAYNRTRPLIEAQIDDLMDLIALLRDPSNIGLETRLDALVAKLQAVRASSQAVNTEWDRLKLQAEQALAQGLVTAFNDVSQALADMITESDSVGDMLDNLGNTVLSFAANFAKAIAQMIVQLLALKFAKQLLSSVGVGVAHSGGVIGDDVNRTRRINPLAMAAAVRYHTGGVVGLAPNERAAILEVGEEVLTEEDPRHRGNIGKGGGGSSQSQGLQDIKIVNAWDSAEIMQQALATRPGQRVFFNWLRGNRGAVMDALK